MLVPHKTLPRAIEFFLRRFAARWAKPAVVYYGPLCSRKPASAVVAAKADRYAPRVAVHSLHIGSKRFVDLAGKAALLRSRLRILLYETTGFP
jgi:hypothetical protein